MSSEAPVAPLPLPLLLLPIILLLSAPALAAVAVPDADAQVLDLTDDRGEPCIFNSTAPHRIMQNCQPHGRWLEFSLVGWQWITGGNLSALIAAALILGTWMKYRTAIYPLFIGIIFLPLTYFLFPAEFLTFAFVLGALAVGISIWWVLVRQTRETD